MKRKEDLLDFCEVLEKIAGAPPLLMLIAEQIRKGIHFYIHVCMYTYVYVYIIIMYVYVCIYMYVAAYIALALLLCVKTLDLICTYSGYSCVFPL